VSYSIVKRENRFKRTKMRDKGINVGAEITRDSKVVDVKEIRNSSRHKIIDIF